MTFHPCRVFSLKEIIGNFQEIGSHFLLRKEGDSVLELHNLKNKRKRKVVHSRFQTSNN